MSAVTVSGTDLMRLSGEQLLPLPPNFHLTLTEEGRRYILEGLRKERGMSLATIPIVCKGQDCPILSSCWLNDLGHNLPINRPCPIEAKILHDDIEGLMQELEVNPANIVDLAMVKELAVCQLLERRAMAQMAQDPRVILEDETVVDTRTGRFGKSRKMNPIFNVIEKLAQKKQRLREALLATREAKSKDKIRKLTDASQVSSMIQKRLRELSVMSALQSAPAVYDVPVQLTPATTEVAGDVPPAADR